MTYMDTAIQRKNGAPPAKSDNFAMQRAVYGMPEVNDRQRIEAVKVMAALGADSGTTASELLESLAALGISKELVRTALEEIRMEGTK